MSLLPVAPMFRRMREEIMVNVRGCVGRKMWRDSGANDRRYMRQNDGDDSDLYYKQTNSVFSSHCSVIISFNCSTLSTFRTFNTNSETLQG